MIDLWQVVGLWAGHCGAVRTQQAGGGEPQAYQEPVRRDQVSQNLPGAGENKYHMSFLEQVRASIISPIWNR